MKRDLIVLLVLAALAMAWLVQRALEPAAPPGGLSSRALLGSAPEEFRRVTGPEPLNFPADHALHPGYRNEWWYFTGNLDAEDGRRFGFQFTLFRFEIGSGTQPDSEFAAEAVWMAHLALSDVDGERFFSRERFARDSLGLAGATAERWWLRDWEVTRTADGWRLVAGMDGAALDLVLAPAKPVVLQGDAGYSRKGAEPGNASRYYSITRIDTSGQVRIDGAPVAVTGQAWLDREWGSSQLGEGIAGWDWFALQLDDGRDLMLYRLRTDAGEPGPFSAGALVEADGGYTILAREDFELLPLEWWRDRDGVRWPVAWRVRLPAAGLDARVEPAFGDQRWYATVGYWEGAVDVIDDDGRPLGRGYLELSGY
ncbi:MAG: lipocalin-like domain-containing protein [Wenzhouxiangellaceae bacterium]|nr:lipocalin-like domain-containing protein [Wenzhouxiangellaceae bacterium]